MRVVEDCCNFFEFSHVYIYARCKAALKLKLSFPSLTILSSRSFMRDVINQIMVVFFWGGKLLQFCGGN